MKTAFKFGRYSLKQGQLPMATGRLVEPMAGQQQEAPCHQ